MNKKIKNATNIIYQDISFKSLLEKKIYQTLVDLNIDVKYEPMACCIWSKDHFNSLYYDRIGKKGFKKIESKAVKIGYTPDFIFMYKNVKVFLEVKGFKNDVFPYKAKLFRAWLDNYSSQYNIKTCYAVVYAIKDLNALLLDLDKIMEVPIDDIKELIKYLPKKDISIANELLEVRDWEELLDLVISAITKIEYAMLNKSNKYKNIEIDKLYNLQSIIPDNI